MKIANLSVHTMRTRWRDVRGWLQRRRPDIVALQKIGSKKDFPTEALLDIGYESTFLGRRSAADLGIAILSHRNFRSRKYWSDNCRAVSERRLGS